MPASNLQSPISITAIVLAAGMSSRYGNGVNKLLLPFGNSFVLHQTLRQVRRAGIANMVVVTGHQREQVQARLQNVNDLPNLRWAHNPSYQHGEMLSSIKTGLRELNAAAALIVLGDQPLLPAQIIARVCAAYAHGCGHIIAPRYQGQRGHPVLLGSAFWDAAHALPHGAFLRDLLRAHASQVTHLQVNTDLILRDVDTPEAYADCLALQKLSAQPHRSDAESMTSRHIAVRPVRFTRYA